MEGEHKELKKTEIRNKKLNDDFDNNRIAQGDARGWRNHGALFLTNIKRKIVAVAAAAATRSKILASKEAKTEEDRQEGGKENQRFREKKKREIDS